MRDIALDYLRILGMLGVIAIHVGSDAIINPYFNKNFFFILQMLSRYSIPIFFFISGVGLFRKYTLDKEFHYLSFLKAKFSGLFVPYFCYSLFYYCYFFDLNHPIVFLIQDFLNGLFWGYACYHLYFVVILLYFYLGMPLWRSLLQVINNKPLMGFIALLLLQLVFNYISMNYLRANTGLLWVDNLIKYRLNYMPLHYIFIFMMGAYIGNNYAAAMSILSNWRIYIYMCLAATVGLYFTQYMDLFAKGYSLEQVVNSLQQLSVPGFLYSAVFILAAFVFCHHLRVPAKFQPMLLFLSAASSSVYFIHPLFLYNTNIFVSQFFPLVTGANRICVYVLVLTLSLVYSYIFIRLTSALSSSKNSLTG